MKRLRLLIPTLAVATVLLAGCEDWQAERMPDSSSSDQSTAPPAPAEP